MVRSNRFYFLVAAGFAASTSALFGLGAIGFKPVAYATSIVTQPQSRTKVVVTDAGYNRHGQAWADYDNDGDPDVFITTKCRDPANCESSVGRTWFTAGSLSVFLCLASQGAGVRLLRSANLNDWENWQTVTLGETPLELSDPEPRGGQLFLGLPFLRQGSQTC